MSRGLNTWYNRYMPRNSPLNNPKTLKAAIEDSSSIKEVLGKLGLRAAGGNYKSLRDKAAQFEIELPSWDYSKNVVKAKKFTDSEVFVENSSYVNRLSLKRRLYNMGIKEECTECGGGPEWNGIPLTLQLEHINGVHNDNRLENLTILCPNCHSQTPTYAGKKTTAEIAKTLRASLIRKAERKGLTGFCSDCSKEITGEAKRCIKCESKSRYSTSYPDIDVLVGQVMESSFDKVGRSLGVSGSAVRKHVANLVGVDHPVFKRRSKRAVR